MGKKMCKVLEPAPGGNVFFDFLKAKNKEKIHKICFSLDQIKKNFAHFGGKKSIYKNF